MLSLDEEDRIVEANDRAMEILGQLLPKAGAPPALQDLRPVTFGSFIHPTIYISPNETYRSSESPDPPRAEEFSDAIYAEYIRQERGRGVSSRYYARLKGADRAGRAWIRVWGTPILGRPNGAKGRRTFGIFERAIFWPELEKRFNADNRSKDVRNAPRASADAASEARSRGSDHRDAGAGKREQDGADPEATMWSARLSRGTER
ncbi:MAG: hypothetical protein EPO68_12850 [Planctomycetota bacterium]|nr:MAG: hypothetical protein EPO68_12850 [Planctomycetota bacterium]